MCERIFSEGQACFRTGRIAEDQIAKLRILNENFGKVVYHVSKPFINFHGANSRLCIENFIGTIAVGLAHCIDLIAGSKAKLTSRLTYQHIDFACK